MATVPRYDLPQVNPIPAIGTPESEVGGERVGAAIEGLSGQLNNAGNMLAQHAIALQGLQNEASAKDAMTQYSTGVADINAKYMSLEGKNAVDAHPQFQSDLTALRAKVKGTLPNAEAARMFDQVASRQENYSIQTGARYAASQNKVWMNNASVSRVQSLQDSVLQNPTDDKFFNQTSAAIDAEVQSQGELHGWDDATIKAQQQAAHGKAWANRIGQIELTDPLAASKMFHDNRALIDGPNQLAIEKSLDAAMDGQGTRKLADGIVNGHSGLNPGAIPAGMNWDAYGARTMQVESGNNPSAHAKTSSAAGLGQFTTSTWNQFLAAKHPELLGSPVDSRYDPALSREATIWYGQQNAAVLAKNGLPVNAGNVYLGHFLGPQGAVNMLKAPIMAIAASVNPSAAKANHSVFYNADGSPKAVGEVVAWAARKMGGNAALPVTNGQGEPLTPQSDGHWLANALAQAQVMADQVAPGNATFAATLQSRITTAYHNVQTQKAANAQADYDTVETHVLNVGGEPIVDPEQVIGPQADQQVRAAFTRLPPEKQKGLLAQINANAAHENENPTPKQESDYNALVGMRLASPQTFEQTDLNKFDLTPKARREMALAQTKTIMTPPKAISFEHAMTVAKPILQAAGISPTTFDDKTQTHALAYNSFMGLLNAQLLQQEGQSKRTLSDADIATTVSRLLRQVPGPAYPGLLSRTFGHTAVGQQPMRLMDLPVVEPKDVAGLPKGTYFRTNDNRVLVKP